MIHKLLIIVLVLAVVGCASRTSNNNGDSTESEPPTSVVEIETLSPQQITEGLKENEYGLMTASPELLAKIDVARYHKYGLTEIETIDPFVVLSNEKIVLKDPETANDGLNGIRFEEWGDKEWLNNNYIRSVRLYLDAYCLGLVKNEEFGKHKAAMRGKFVICSIEPFMGGGAWMHIVFVDDPSFSLRFWVYSFVMEQNPITIDGYDVRSAEMIDEPIGLTSEEIRDILKQNEHNQLW